MHDENDGRKTFGATTTYDWYVVKNTKKENPKPTVKFQDNKIVKNFNLTRFSYIPNLQTNFDLYDKVFAKDGEEKVNVIRSCEYHTQRKYMSNKKTSDFKYPCILNIKNGDKLNLAYSSIKKGHFGIPKFIFSNGHYKTSGTIVDEKGLYGTTEYSYYIVDDVKNLHKIKLAFDSPKFRELCGDFITGQPNINYKVINQFKKDFWKEFI